LNIQECLERFLENKENVRPLAEFCRVSPDSVKNWGKETLPKGPFLVKALTYVTLHSPYIPQEIEFNSILHRTMVVLGMGWVSPEELAEYLGFAQVYEIYRPLFGRRQISPAKASLLEMILKTRFQLQLNYVLSQAPKREAPNYGKDVADFRQLSELLSVVEPAMDLYLDSSPEIRQEFRAALEAEGLSVFTASNMLYRISEKFNALCSERSYQTYKTKK
jgi:hypothetical protein